MTGELYIPQVHQVSLLNPNDNINVAFLGEKSCWATSHTACEKLQRVNLVRAGFKPEELDEERPPIKVRDW